jgi:hypothetical protein
MWRVYLISALSFAVFGVVYLVGGGHPLLAWGDLAVGVLGGVVTRLAYVRSREPREVDGEADGVTDVRRADP